jgi:predicted nuclease of predicted toxin-antitoxin system
LTSVNFRSAQLGEFSGRRSRCRRESQADSRKRGHDAVHLADLGLLGAQDDAVLEAAAGSGRVLLCADTDFDELLTLGRHPGPSVVIFRRAPHRPERQVALLLASLVDIEDSVTAGAVVVLTSDPGSHPATAIG